MSHSSALQLARALPGAPRSAFRSLPQCAWRATRQPLSTFLPSRNHLPGLVSCSNPNGKNSNAHVASFNTAVVQEVGADAATSSDESDQEEDRVDESANALTTENFGQVFTEEGSLEPEEVVKVKADNEDPALKLVNCGLSQSTLKALEKKGITALFPIQKHVFEPAMAGKDLICRAKTGSGKTLAFALPVIESLIKEDRESRPMSGRAPRAIVMAPTRELANQVSNEFGSAAGSLKLLCCYGGVPVGGQKTILRTGVDVVCGTPGRIIDLIQQRAMDLSKIRYVILDESDQMLDMGFEEDMEQILQHAPDKRQTMLFSATLPQWVKKVARKYLTDHIVVDLVGDEATGRISDTIRAMAIVVNSRSKQQMLGDLLSAHAASSNSIVFTKTKREADNVASSLVTVMPTEALHGDISQTQREATLKKFRLGRFNVLVATDVAARGLDIPNVDLVVHYDMPDGPEAFLHRSGRTGRAGKSGSTIVMVDKNDTKAFSRILRESQTKIEMIGPPAPREVMQASAKTVLKRMQVVEPEVVKFFQPAAEKVIDSGNQAQVLAAAFAAMSGFTKVPEHRSLLDNRVGHVTLRCMGRPGRVQSRAVVSQLVRDILGAESVTKIGTIEMVDDHKTQMTGALFDLPVDLAITFLQNASQQTSNDTRDLQFDRPKCLSLDHVMVDQRGRGGYGGGYGDRRGGGFRGNRSGNRDGWGRNGGRGNGWGQDSRGGGWGQDNRGGGWGRDRRGGGSWGNRRDDRGSGYGGGYGGGNGRRDGGYGRRESWGNRQYSSNSRSGGGSQPYSTYSQDKIDWRRESSWKSKTPKSPPNVDWSQEGNWDDLDDMNNGRDGRNSSRNNRQTDSDSGYGRW